jgi:hypothetical protein
LSCHGGGGVTGLVLVSSCYSLLLSCHGSAGGGAAIDAGVGVIIVLLLLIWNIKDKMN